MENSPDLMIDKMSNFLDISCIWKVSTPANFLKSDKISDIWPGTNYEKKYRSVKSSMDKSVYGGLLYIVSRYGWLEIQDLKRV